MSSLFVPSALQRVSILSLTRLSPDLWTNAGQMGLVVTNRGPRVAAYIWDMHAMADLISDDTDDDGYGVIDASEEEWHELWVDSYSGDAGSGVFEPMGMAIPITSFNHPVASRNIYKADMTFSPLFTAQPATGDPTDYSALDADTQTRAGETIVWYAALFPAYPIVLSSTTPQGVHYGPSFAESIRFSARGGERNSDVEVSASFTGGKSFKLPQLSYQPDLMTTAVPGVLAGTGGAPVLGPTPNPSDFMPHRTAVFSDCLLGEGVWFDANDMFNDLAQDRYLESIDPEARVIEMSLDIRSTYGFTVPQPKPPRTDKHGPRWIALKDRIVTGSITVFSPNDPPPFDVSGSSPLTLYFGGPFLFPMTNVDWQWPTTKIRVGSGYVYEYRFAPRADPNAVINGFGDSTMGMPVGEFAIGTLI